MKKLFLIILLIGFSFVAEAGVKFYQCELIAFDEGGKTGVRCKYMNCAAWAFKRSGDFCICVVSDPAMQEIMDADPDCSEIAKEDLPDRNYGFYE